MPDCVDQLPGRECAQDSRDCRLQLGPPGAVRVERVGEVADRLSPELRWSVVGRSRESRRATDGSAGRCAATVFPMTDLATFFAAALADLPTAAHENLTLTAATTGEPPPELETDRLLLKGSFPGRVYHPSNTRLDLVDFFADRATYRALGLLTL